MRILGRFLASVFVLGLVAPAIAADRTADEILKEYDALKLPSTAAIQKAEGDERQKLIEEYIKARNEVMGKQAELVGELYKVAPDHAKLPKLMANRWMTLASTGKTDEASKEIDEVLASTKSELLKVEGLYTKAMLMARKASSKPEEMMATVEEFMKLAPKDDRGPNLLYGMAQSLTDEAKKAAIEARILKDFPESRVARTVKGAQKQKDGIGKPFDLEFTDVAKGSTVAMKDLKGKVVVIDFWATWCGPCVAEMPTMKKLYAEYKDKGVEFIGVSLDQPDGGLDKLKAFVEKEQVGWPQFFDGKPDSRNFATNWGITAIPTVFIIDTEGNLYSTEARGKLETLIPELLKKGKKDAGAGGQ